MATEKVEAVTPFSEEEEEEEEEEENNFQPDKNDASEEADDEAENEEMEEEEEDSGNAEDVDLATGTDPMFDFSDYDEYEGEWGDEKQVHFERTDISASASFASIQVEKAESQMKKLKEVSSIGTSLDLNALKPLYPPRPSIHREDGKSTISFHSKYPAPAEGEPSRLDLYYKSFDVEGELREVPLEALSASKAKHETVGADLHRSSKIFGDAPKIKKWNNMSQTREMSLVNKYMAEKVFRHYYPIRDDYVEPGAPSRIESLAATIEKVEADTDGDKIKIGPKVKWPRKMRLLPPVPETYHKSSTHWTGSIFNGESINGQFHHGNFIYPLGATYASEFQDGHIHTSKHKGLITYPRGDTFEGEWKKGRHIHGKITFSDYLDYQPEDWKYCVPPDRRFYIERDIGVKPAGRTLYNDRIPQPLIPPGHYDTGDGVYNPSTGVITGFNGQKLREANVFECRWILSNCRKFKTAEERYIPKFHPSRLPGSFTDKYVKQ